MTKQRYIQNLLRLEKTHYDKESLVSFVEKKVKEATSRNERSMERKYKTEEADRVENEKKAAARIRW